MHTWYFPYYVIRYIVRLLFYHHGLYRHIQTKNMLIPAYIIKLGDCENIDWICVPRFKHIWFDVITIKRDGP